MAKSGSDRLTTAVNLLVIGVVAYAAFSPNGWVTSRATDYLENRKRAGLLEASWGQLVGEDAGAGDSTLVMFVDYMCPACEGAHFRWMEELQTLGVDVRYRHVPRPGAEPAARAAICAEDDPQFGTVQDLLYTSTEWAQSTFSWSQFGLSAGLGDVDAFVNCLESRATSDRLIRDEEWAAKLGLRSTPTFVAHGEMVVGVPDEGEMRRLLSR